MRKTEDETVPDRQLPSVFEPTGASLLAGTQRTEQRIVLEREVVLQIADRPQCLRASSANISAGGMFIRCQQTQPAGAALSFELAVGRGNRRIRGQAEVVWYRRFNLGEALPAGMGIRFLRLDSRSRRIVRSIVGERSGGPPAAGAEVSRPLSGLTSSQQRKLHSYVGYAVAKPERKWPRRLHGLLSRAARRVARPSSA